MSNFRRRIMLIAQNISAYFGGWFRGNGWFGSNGWIN